MANIKRANTSGITKTGTAISDVPDAPTIGTATAGTESATVTYTAAATGGAVVTFTATSTPGSVTGTGASPITVSGLTASTSYTFTVSGANTTGTSPASAASNSVTPTAATRGLFGGGYTVTNTIDYIQIETTGNATDFGDLITARAYGTGFGSATRGLFAHGYNGASTYYNSIEYVTTATTGNATSFGNATLTGMYRGSCASATRGVMSGSYNNGTVTNVIDYVTMGSEGNAIDFGDMLAEVYSGGGCSSPTRGLFGGFARYGQGNLARIEYITIATTGNSTNFGDKTTVSAAHWSGLSSSTRGMWLGGYSTASATNTNVIDYVTIASTGNATDFGDLINDNSGGSLSSSIRGVTANGIVNGTNVNSMEYITIATTGNGTDFGDLTVARYAMGTYSNGHGGL